MKQARKAFVYALDNITTDGISVVLVFANDLQKANQTISEMEYIEDDFRRHLLVYGRQIMNHEPMLYKYGDRLTVTEINIAPNTGHLIIKND